jgi:hypothetical protein
MEGLDAHRRRHIRPSNGLPTYIIHLVLVLSSLPFRRPSAVPPPSLPLPHVLFTRSRPLVSVCNQSSNLLFIHPLLAVLALWYVRRP